MPLGAETVTFGPPLAPPTVSLLTAADLVEEMDERWVAGIHYESEACGLDNLPNLVFDLCANFTKPVSGSPGIVDWRPYGIVTSDRCSSLGWQSHDYIGRATRRLIACESKLIEGELWNSTLNATTGNPAIAGSTATTVSGATTDVLYTIPALEQAIADCSCGNRYMIHMRPYIFNLLITKYSGAGLRFDGRRWLTPMDNVVVPGRGYSGTGPAGQAVGATEWVYATPMVQIRHSPQVVLPGTMAEAMDRQTNTVVFRAERAALASYDTKCCHFALNVSRT